MALDVAIADSFQAGIRLVHVADAAILEGVEAFRAAESSAATELLQTAAGVDGVLAADTDFEAVLRSDDKPLINRRELMDLDGRTAGRYTVYLRNDVGDGGVVDTNNAIRLYAVAETGPARSVLEADLRKPVLPRFSAAITLGVSDPALDLRLRRPWTAEKFADSVATYADEVYRPSLSEPAPLHGVGAPNDYRVVVIEGDCEFSGPGYGVLLVRGELTFGSNFSWNGLILVLGQGVLRWPSATYGQINGALFVSRTRDGNRSPQQPLGELLQEAGPVAAELAGDGIAELRPDEIQRANDALPFVVRGYRER